MLCDPTEGVPVFILLKTKTDGTIVSREATYADGTAYTGDPLLLTACGSTAEAGTVSYGYNILCDPDTGAPVILQVAFNSVGSVITTQGITPAGDPYDGDLEDLVACSGGEEAGNQTAWQTGLCDPTTNVPVLIQIRYQPDGTPISSAGFYYDLTEYTGNLVDLISCTGGASTPEESTLTWNPSETGSARIGNPGSGLQTSEITALSSSLVNPENYPFRNMLKRFQWLELESDVEGVYDFSGVTLVLDQARAANQIINLRVYHYDPGSGYGCPDYSYVYAGWQVTDDAGPGTFKINYWGNASVLTAYSNFLIALAAVIGNHPAFGSFDVGWGAYGENNWSGTHYTGTKTAAAPALGVGAEIPNLTLAQAQDFYNIHQAAFPGKILVTPAADDDSFDYAVGSLGMGARMDGFGFKNNPGGCPGGGQQMCVDAIATFISPGTYPNAWEFNENIEEVWGNLYTGGAGLNWLSSGFDYQASFNWLWQQAHTSELNVKNKFSIPDAGMKAAFEAMLLKIGYRFILQSLVRPVQANANGPVSFQTNWENVGCAPNYRDHKIAFKLYDPATGLEYIEVTTTESTPWMPGTINGSSDTITIPDWFPSSSATVSVALVNPLHNLPDIELANDGNDGRFWYDFPTAMTVVNTAPGVVPARVYAAQFVFASSTSLSSTSTLFRRDGTSFTLSCVIPSLTTSATRGFITKGNRGAAASLEYWLGYSSTVDRIRFIVSNGATLYTVDADNFGPVSTLPGTSYPLRIVAWLDFTASTINIQVNNSLVNTTGSVGLVPAGSQTFRIGADATDGYMQGTIAQPRIWDLVLDATQRSQIMTPSYLTRQQMLFSLTRGLRYSWELTEATGAARIDFQSGRSLTDTNSVARVVVL